MDKRLEKKQQKAILKEREAHHKEVSRLAKVAKKEEKVCPTDAFIALQHVDKIYPNHVQAVYDFNLNIKEGEFIIFVGPSGCGKSTTLRMIAGLEEITAGNLFIDGIYANELEPKDRQIGMVFQSYALYPHMTVYQNMAFGLNVIHMPKEEIDERIHAAAKTLQIEEYLDRRPNALSGGQCQRVALGRAIVTNAKVFLMDEPLSNLDAKLRVAMRSEIVKLHRSLKTTTIYVTHDQTEAMTMADRIVVMSKGYVQQIGTPKEIFHTPANIFVATFVGSPAMNLLNGKSNGDSIDLGAIKLPSVKGLGKKSDEFYAKEIEETKNTINEWHETYLRRERQNHRFERMFGKDGATAKSIAKYLKGFTVIDEDVRNDILVNGTGLQKEEFLCKYENVLKDILYKENEAANPNIAALAVTLGKLEEALSSSTREIIFGVRPEHVIATKKKTDGLTPLVVSVSELLGSEYYVHLDYEEADLVSKITADESVEPEDKLYIDFDLKHIHVFDPITKKRIN